MNLDNIQDIKKLDTALVAESIESLPLQIKQVLKEVSAIKIPASYKKINKVVVSGMGGSNLGARIIKAVFNDQIKTPIIILADYTVPALVDKNTLYILSSYSGNTEETLNTYQEVKKRRAKIIALTADYKNNSLQNLMIKDNIPGYVFRHDHNPSDQPRLALGYSIFGMISLMNKAGVLKLNKKEIEQIISKLEIWNKSLNTTNKLTKNIAKKIATKLKSKEPILVGGEFLFGNLHTMRNQFSETSKNFSSYLVLPDLNHFAMEGLAHPISNKKDFVFLFFDSDLYHPRIQKRAHLTKQVVKKNKIQILDYSLKGLTKLEQSFEVLQLGTWITYYLGLLNEIKPGQVPFVDWFKKQLG